MRMRYHLLHAKAQNKAYVDFTTDSLLLQLTRYYDRHGTPNDRMLAYYLLEIKRLIREHNAVEKQVPIREPDLLIILTGGQIAYTRPDGVKVIPLACLKD